MNTAAVLRSLLLVAAGLGWAACGSSQPGADGGGSLDGGDASPPSAECSPAVGGPEGDRHVLRFERASPAIRVHLARRYVRAGPGESLIFALDGFLLERDGACRAIREAAALGYDNTHHNWRDRARVVDGGIEYRLEMHWMLPALIWNVTLTGVQPGSDQVVYGPFVLTTTGGPGGLGAYPSRMHVRISEVVPENTGGWTDEAGEAEPWIELWNVWSEAVDISGWSLSNDPAQRRRWSFPAGTVIARHQVLVVAADGEPTEGPLHTSFRLAPGPGSLVLTDATGVTPGERSYPAVPAGRGLRYAPLADAFEPSTRLTPGTESD